MYGRKRDEKEKKKRRLSNVRVRIRLVVNLRQEKVRPKVVG
jgi:hypothetical protein